MAWTTDVVRVRVPATSANLGPGFDALGLALSLYDDVEAWVCESGLSIEISGDGADLAGAGEDHLVVRAMRAAFAVTGGLLPDLVPHRDAAANAGRSALLVAALTQLPAEPGTLLAATRDWLHQDYRAGAMPETAALVGRLRAAGIPAVVSGAGPSVLALLGGPETLDYRHHLDSWGSIVRETGSAWHISSLDVERQGARVLLPEPLSG